jgi:transcriptional regulator with XRE-family HTH domain
MDNQGEKIKEIVREKGLSDEEFAKMLEITRQGVHDIYKRKIIKPKQMKEILQKLGFTGSILTENLQQIEVQKDMPTYDIRDFYERIIKEKDAHIEDLRKMLFLMDKKRDVA